MMHFLYASDDGFSAVLRASMHSLLETHRGSSLTIHIVGEGLSAGTMESVLAMGNQYGQVIDLVEMPDFRRLLGREVDTRRFTMSAFSRLFVDSLIASDIERIVYLDCDTIITRSLAELWDFDLDGAVIGAVNDCRNQRYLTHLGLSRDDTYINSGVLLIDLVKFRHEKWQSRFAEAILAYDGLLEFPDNDLICMLMQDRLAVLPPQYNMISPVRMCSFAEVHRLRRPTVYYSEDVFEQAKRAPAVLHYTTYFGVNGRPWQEKYDTDDGAPFRAHLSATGGVLRPAAHRPWIRRLASSTLRGVFRPVALYAFGVAHSIVKPNLDRAARNRIRAVQGSVSS